VGLHNFAEVLLSCTLLLLLLLPPPPQKYCKEVAHVKLLRDGKELTTDITLDAPSRLIPFHIKVGVGVGGWG